MVKGIQIKEQRMKKKMVWLTVAIAAFCFYAPAETVITSPTGLPDESDVVLESAVKAVKEIPADTVKAVGGAVSFTADELRNTAHGVKAAFAGDTPREAARQEMLGEVAESWDRSNGILMRSYAVSPAVGAELAPSATEKDTAVDVRGFFEGIEFPEGATAYYRPEFRRLVVCNRPANLDAVEDILSRHHRAERNFKQVEIKAKFIEVSQSTLNEMGFSWDITADTHLDGSWQMGANSSLGQTALRTAAGAFGGSTLGSGSMVLTKSGWMPLDLTISALEQNSDSDTLSAPSLTTMDGKAAEIWVGEDRAVPKGFDVKSTDINIHVEHNGWKSELMGVNFSVTPEILKNDLIRLKLNPKIIDLIGYDNYKVSPNANMMIWNGANPNTVRPQGLYPILKYAGSGVSQTWQDMSDSLSDLYGSGADPNSSSTWPGLNAVSIPGATGSPASPFVSQTATPNTGYHESYRNADHATFGQPLAAISGQLPYFRVREIKTQVDVANGSTVGLGGLIYDRLETYKDKVPVLGSIPLIGRLFRSEGERSIKRNLMIFVSANQLANDGQRKSDAALNN
jgi:general secretion pathway protein D